MTELLTVVAFDVGLKRTGIAVGQTLTDTAQPAGQLVVKQGRFDEAQLAKVFDRWQPDRVIVGDPQNDDPHLRKVVNRLKSFIQQNYKLTIIDWNEAYTSASANADLQAMKGTLEDKIVLRDQLAACLMLYAYFDTL